MYEENKSMTLSAIWSYYGTKIEDLYESIYVRNLTDGKLYSVSKLDPQDDYFSGNYDRTAGLTTEIDKHTKRTPLNPSPYATNSSASIINKGVNTYELIKDVSQNAWVQIYIGAGWGTPDSEFSNFKLNFADGSSLTLEQAVENGYIDPLVVIASGGSYMNHMWANSLDIKSGGSSGISSYAHEYIYFKPRQKSILKSLSLTANCTFSLEHDGISIMELTGVDLTFGL